MCNEMPTEVNLQPFGDTLARLDGAISERSALPENPFIRDSVILRFALTFETAVSALRRCLDVVYCLSDALTLSPRQAIRHSARLGLIDNCEAWLRHVENRNWVANAYLESMAIVVANGAAAFAADARALLNAMQPGIADGG